MKVVRDSLPEIIGGLIVASILGLVSVASQPFRQFMLNSIQINLVTLLILAIAIIAAFVITFRLTIRSKLRSEQARFDQRIQDAERQYKESLKLLTEELDEYIDSAKKDTLTGTYNQNQIEPFLDERSKEAEERNEIFALVLIDIDNFKRINDTYNHETGNFILRQLAREITPRSPHEHLIRYGGDEFLIISKLGTDISGGYGFAERLRNEISRFNFLVDMSSSKRESITISCGVTEFIVGKDTKKTALARVAQALQMAKGHVAQDGTVKNFTQILQWQAAKN